MRSIEKGDQLELIKRAIGFLTHAIERIEHFNAEGDFTSRDDKISQAYGVIVFVDVCRSHPDDPIIFTVAEQMEYGALQHTVLNWRDKAQKDWEARHTDA